MANNEPNTKERDPNDPDALTMARLSLSKSTLTQLTRQLKTYRNFLPSLDLKRRQLLAEQEKARLELRELTHREEALRPMVEKQVPMLGYTHVDVRGIVEDRSASSEVR